jgi:hypothetical protein
MERCKNIESIIQGSAYPELFTKKIEKAENPYDEMN